DAVVVVGRPAFQRCASIPFADRLVKWIGGDRVPNPLSRRGRVVDAIATANYRFGTETIGHTDTRREIRGIGADKTTPDSQSGLAGEDISKTDDASVQILESLLRRNDKAAELAGGRVDEVRVEVRHQIVLVDKRRDQLIPEAQVESQPGAGFPGVLEEI